jgi:hypothetical protein
MAIFVVEDDARPVSTTLMVIALSPGHQPIIRRNHLDSTFYSHPSLLKTIELMLGLPTLSLFDLIANDLRASFTDQPDFHLTVPRLPPSRSSRSIRVSSALEARPVWMRSRRAECASMFRTPHLPHS